MKKLFLLLAILGMVFSACESGGGVEEENGGNSSTLKIKLSKQTVDVDFEVGSYSISVTSPYSWDAVSKNDWIIVNSKTGIAGTEELLFSVERNIEGKERKGTILITNSIYNLATELYVVQNAFVPEMTIDTEIIEFAAKSGAKDVAITANFEYEVSTSASWVTCSKNQKGITVSVPNYGKIEERTANITISSGMYNISKTIKIRQKGLTEEEYAEQILVYTSSDGMVVTPNNYFFGANVVSNTYKNGQGVILFDAPITSIGGYAFFGCTSLTSVTIGDSVTEIGENAFRDCISLASVTIPDSVTSIGEYAFCSCTSLTSVTIPDSVTEIGNGAFSGCTSLTSVTIPNSVTSIGGYAFSGCTSLTSVTIPDSVTEIGDYAFRGCTSLTSVTIPDSVTSIGYSAFRDCTSLTSVTIPDSVTSIGYEAFRDCTSLTSVTIPDSVTEIESWTFYNCTSLTSITIGDGVTEIGVRAFYSCTSLKEVYCKPTTPPSGGSDMFSYSNGYIDIYIGSKIYVPRSSVDAYKNAQYWSYYPSYIEPYDFE